MTGDTELHDLFMGHAVRTERTLVGLYARVTSGDISKGVFRSLAATVVEGANVGSWMLADVSLAAWMTAQTGRATPALGIAPGGEETDRILAGLDTLMQGLDDAKTERDALLARYGRSEPARAFQRAYVAAMQERPEVAGYRRVLNAEACELCRWRYRGGKVFSVGTPFAQHPGCGCYPEPVSR